jgi:hypothetical protein
VASRSTFALAVTGRPGRRPERGVEHRAGGARRRRGRPQHRERAGHPSPYLAFEVGWRGVGYGGVDALALSVFPALVAVLILGVGRRGLARKLAFAG